MTPWLWACGGGWAKASVAGVSCLLGCWGAALTPGIVGGAEGHGVEADGALCAGGAVGGTGPLPGTGPVGGGPIGAC